MDETDTNTETNEAGDPPISPKPAEVEASVEVPTSSGAVEEEPSKYPPRLSGSAKKRFKYFLAHGHNVEEARTLSAQRIEKKPSLVLAIMHLFFPDDRLTTEQLEAVQEEILKQVVLQKGQKVKPKFVGTELKDGYLVVTCADEATVNWLKQVVKDIQPSEGVKLSIVDEDDVPSVQKVVGFFPRTADESTETILDYIAAQNDNLDVSKWTVLKRIAGNDGAMMQMAIDLPSLFNLKETGFMVNYKFGQVHLRTIPTKPSKLKNLLATTEPSKASKSDSYLDFGRTFLIDPTSESSTPKLDPSRMVQLSKSPVSTSTGSTLRTNPFAKLRKRQLGVSEPPQLESVRRPSSALSKRPCAHRRHRRPTEDRDVTYVREDRDMYVREGREVYSRQDRDMYVREDRDMYVREDRDLYLRANRDTYVREDRDMMYVRTSDYSSNSSAGYSRR